MTVVPGQLQLDLFAEATLLADQLPDRSRGRTGPERLLVALVRGGLDEDALLPAAGLVLELEQVVSTYPYRWAWGPKPGYDRGSLPRMFDRDRKGERCRVLARGRMNSALIEFEDGYRVVTSRNGLRRAS